MLLSPRMADPGQTCAGACLCSEQAHGLPVAYHCCGGLRPIIGDLIEIGMDVLNPRCRATVPAWILYR